jgi:hypothetical protein
MLQDARQTFYSSNRFIVLTSDYILYPFSQPQAPRGQEFEATTFLTKVVPCDSLGSLRDLEIVFSARQYTHLGIQSAALADWQQAIEYAAPHWKKLSLTLFMGMECHPDPDPIYTDDIPASQKALMDVYEQIVSPLRRLQCLDSFFVYAYSPFSLPNTGRTSVKWILPQQPGQHLEKMVMGSAYDSSTNGKAERRWSMWLSQMWVYA